MPPEMHLILMNIFLLNFIEFISVFKLNENKIIFICQ